jgi:pimeloyl-ACP methyl ester carboxylesterase
LTVMRDHPHGIRSVIIDSVHPPLVDLYSEFPVNVARAFNTLFAGCAADAHCNETYPNLETTFYQTVDELDADPLQVDLNRGPVMVDGAHFVDGVFYAMYRTDVIPWIPSMIASASRGNLQAMSGALEALLSMDGISVGMHYSLRCRDEVPFESPEEASALAASLPAQIRKHFAFPFDLTLCQSWQSGQADAIEKEPVVSDIPTLVVSGQYDPITPPAWGALAAETLSNSSYYEFPGIGHGVIRSSECALGIGLQFLDDPTTEPDSSCIDLLDGPDFK